MPNKLLKCYFCNKKDKEDKIEVRHGSVKKRYHVQNCYDKYLADQEFKKKEKEEWDSCYQTIKELHDLNGDVPPSFIGLIQRLRNGNSLMGMRKTDTKHFKQGFPYTVIQMAYEEKADLIKWKRSSWNGSTGRFLTYVLFYYITDIIEDVNGQFESQKKQLKEQQRQQELVKGYTDDNWSFKNETRNNNISDLLD